MSEVWPSSLAHARETIIELRAENERLRTENQTAWNKADELDERARHAEAEIERLTALHEAAAARAEMAQIEIERLLVRINDQNVDYKKLEDANTKCLRTIDALRADNARLTTALQRIDGINDNPACYNPMIEEVLRTVLEHKP